MRHQAEKIKLYRNQLEEAGILVKTPVRCRSESNLSVIAGRKSPMKLARSVDELSDGGIPGVSLSKLTGYGQCENVEQLKKEIAELRNCVIRYDRALVGLKGSLRSTSAGSSDSGSESMKRSLTSHIPVATTRLRTISASSTSTNHSMTAMPSSAAAQQLQKLEQEVVDLKRKLVESGKANSDLQRMLDELKRERSVKTKEIEKSDSSTQTTKHYTNLEEKLQKLQGVCSSYMVQFLFD